MSSCAVTICRKRSQTSSQSPLLSSFTAPALQKSRPASALQNAAPPPRLGQPSLPAVSQLGSYLTCWSLSVLAARPSLPASHTSSHQ